MSFQAYLDTIEKKTGLTPRQLLEIAREKGLGQEGVKAAEILDWLKEDYQLGRATAWRWSMSSRRDRTSPANTSDSGGMHNDDSAVLWLDGIATKPSN